MAAHFQSFTQIAPKEETFGPEHVSVARVDLLTPHAFKLYVDRLELLGQADPSLAPEPPVVYAACNWAHEGDGRHIRTRTEALVVGQSLPLRPLRLAENLAEPLEPEATYEEPCRIMRIPDGAIGVELCAQGTTN